MLSEACFEADVLRLADWEEKEKEKEEKEENMQSFGELNLWRHSVCDLGGILSARQQTPTEHFELRKVVLRWRW